MLDTTPLDADSGSAGTSGFTYAAQYGVRRASNRADVYRTQFGSMSAEDYLTPMIPGTQRTDGNVARRLSRYSFIIPPRLFVHPVTDGMLNFSCFSFVLIIQNYICANTKVKSSCQTEKICKHIVRHILHIKLSPLYCLLFMFANCFFYSLIMTL